MSPATRSACPQRTSPRRSRAARPRRARRARGGDRARAPGIAAQVPAAARPPRSAPGAASCSAGSRCAASGVYIPGGKAVYPSSVVMNVVPAQVAGVGAIALASPPQRDHGGRVHPTILAAAGLLGVTEVYAMGGAGAIGALRLRRARASASTRSTSSPVPATTTSRPPSAWCAGVVGTDSEAGATEILVVADARADAASGRGRPRQPGRARRAGGRGAGHRSRRASPTRSRVELAAAAAAHAAQRARRARRSPGRSRRSCSSTTVAMATAVQQRLRPGAPRAAPRATPSAGGIRFTAPARSSSATQLAGEPRRLPGRQQPRAADRRPGALRRGPRARTRSCGRSRSSATTARPSPRCATAIVALAERRGAARARRSRSRPASGQPA